MTLYIDNHVVPKACYEASKEALRTNVPSWASILNTIVSGKLLDKQNQKSMREVNGIAVAQGPNYASTFKNPFELFSHGSFHG